MSTLQTIREKLRNLPFEVPSPSSCAAAPSFAGGSSGSSVSVYVVVGLLIGVAVTALIVKLWLSYKADKPVPAAALPPLPADQYVAQLAQRIKAQEGMRRVEPVVRGDAASRLQPISHQAYPDTSTIGNMPQPEAGSQLTQPPQQQLMDQGPVADGLDANDPYLTPI